MGRKFHKKIVLWRIKANMSLDCDLRILADRAPSTLYTFCKLALQIFSIEMLYT